MEFTTQRLRIHPLALEDVPVLIRLLTDPVVGKTYMVPEFSQPEQAENLARRLVTLSETPGRYMAGIYRSGELLGIIHETEVTGEYVEVGYALLPRYHGQGYCTEALRGAIGYWLEQGFGEIRAGAFRENAASLRVMEKAGMTRLSHTETVSYRGEEHLCICYAARNPDHPIEKTENGKTENREESV